MNRLKAFGRFWYDFIIGDDWKIAVGVAGGLGVSALLVHGYSQAAWYVVPIVVIASLAFSLRMAVKQK